VLSVPAYARLGLHEPAASASLPTTHHRPRLDDRGASRASAMGGGEAEVDWFERFSGVVQGIYPGGVRLVGM
jgi:hypothetical protein